MILLRMKSSKREGSAMMGAYSKWSSEKLGLASIDGKVMANAASSSNTKPEETFTTRPSQSSPVGDPVSCAMQFVKCRLLDLRSNQEKAESDLKDASILSIAAAPFYNNLGVLAFHRRKFAVASLYFLKASQENQKLRQSISSHVSTDSRRHLPESVVDISTDVTYNMGLQMLMLGQFEGALRCFQDVTFKQPAGLLGSSLAMAHLRLAESRLAVYCSRIAAIASSPLGPRSSTPPPNSNHSTVPLRSASPAAPGSSTSSSAPYSTNSNGSASTASKSKSISEIFRGGFLRLPRIRCTEHDSLLDSAYQAANTALLLFERYGRAGVPPPTCRLVTGQKDSSTAFALADRSLLTSRDYVLRVYTHVLLGWMALECGNFAKAIENTNSAIHAHSELESNAVGSSVSVQQLSNTEKTELDHYFFLAHLYQAEAETRLGNLDGALSALSNAPTHLDKYPLLPSTLPQAHKSAPTTAGQMTSHATTYSSSSSSSSSTITGTHAMGSVSPKTALLCNMAAVYIVKKDFAQAQKLLSQALTQFPNLLPAVALQIYLELSVGNVELAVRLMCDFRVQELLCIR
jgi:tetratricopeptide (TPR) repeat protein